MFSAEDVGRRYANRPGCNLIRSEPVGIAVFVMNVRVMAMTRKPLPPIDEFLLRGIGVGITGTGELAGFLGLDKRTISRSLVELRRTEMIDLGPAEGHEAVCLLTSKGKLATDAAERSDLSEISIPVVFHGFRRVPLAIREQELVRPVELRDKGWREIPAIPARYPRPEEIELAKLDNVLAEQAKRDRRGKPPQLLSVRSVAKGVKTLYLPAVMLVYELSGSPGKKQIGFAIDGVQDDDSEREFAACRGPERLVDLGTEEYKGVRQLAAEYLSAERVKALGDLDRADSIKAQYDSALGEVAITKDLLERASQPDTRQELRDRLEAKENQLKQLEEQLAKQKAVRLNAYDCADLLRESLEKAQQSLIIVSAFISTNVVDRLFLERLEGALKRGVKVWIMYGLDTKAGGDPDRGRQRDWTEAENALAELRRRYKAQLKVSNLGDTHEKILLRDGELVATGSFNWLSYRGDRRRRGRREDALLVTNPATVTEYFEELTGRFGSA